jgi:SAM-dependent methyltransferase
MPPDLSQHQREIERSRLCWERKPLLQEEFRRFHALIASWLQRDRAGPIVELGSGIGVIKRVIPECLTTDLFPNPWLDRVENVYHLNFGDGAVSNLILFDVFHHLRYPGTALQECRRVLAPGGRAIVFDPCVSLLGRLVYGILHHEPMRLRQPIEWLAPEGWAHRDDAYYAAQGNAARVFRGREFRARLCGWRMLALLRLPALGYLASGGYSKPHACPATWWPLLRVLERLCAPFPLLFATRMLVVLEKTEAGPADGSGPTKA